MKSHENHLENKPEKQNKLGFLSRIFHKKSQQKSQNFIKKSDEISQLNSLQPTLVDLFSDINLPDPQAIISPEKAKNGAHTFLEMLISYFIQARPYFLIADGKLKQQLIMLHDLYLHLKELIIKTEESRPEFQIDIDLIKRRDVYQQAFDKKNAEYQELMINYDSMKQKWQRDIQEIDQQTVLINAETIVKNLQGFALAQTLNQEISENIARVEQAMNALNCCARFFCRVPASVQRLNQRIDQLEKQRTNLSNDTNALREKMLSRLKIERDIKEEALNTLINNRPALDESDYEAYIMIEGKIRAAENEYVHQVSDNVMFDFVRLYDLLSSINNELIHLYDGSSKSSQNNVQTFKTLREIFHAAKTEIKDRLKNFYCNEPGRFYFEDFLKKFRANKDESVRQAMMNGQASLDMIRDIFPNYQPGASFILGKKL